MNKEEAIDFLTRDLRGRFLEYMEKCYAHYQNIDTFLSLSKSPEEIQRLETCLTTIEEGIKKASEIRNFFLSLISFNVESKSEVAPILMVIDNWELSYTSLDHLQSLHKKNLDFFMQCVEAGVSESEYDQLFKSNKMIKLMDSSKNTLSQQRDMVSLNTFSQLRYEHQ